MFHILRYAKKYRIQVTLAPIFKLLEAIFELFLPYLMAKLIDTGIRQNNLNAVYSIGKEMLAFSVIGLICVLICQYFSSIASQGFGTELRNAMMKRINQLSVEDLDFFGNSTLITRVTNDINQLQLALAMFMRLVVRAPFLCIGSIIMALYIDAKFTIIFIIAVIVFSLLTIAISKKTVPLFQVVQSKLDVFTQRIQENLDGVRVIRAFAQKQHEETKMDESIDDLAASYTRVANISALLNPATTLILNLAIVMILYFGGISVSIGGLQQGQILALINYMNQMILSLVVVSQLVVIFTRAAASARRVNEVLDYPKTVITVMDEQKYITTDDILTYQNVSFSYPESNGMSLSDIDFSMPKGSILGIIGPTGSSKSTLFNLLLRFYTPTEGLIFFNGENILSYNINKLRDQIGYVPQRSALFTGTIRENLCWGKTNATDEECWEALKIAQCDDVVNALPDKLETHVDAGGTNFSGGQRQRLTIARALIKKPPLLLLDDSLSALDYQTDMRLRHALKTDLENTSLIIISQRISSIQDADSILVMDDGQLVASGTHKDLLTKSNFYKEIYASQTKEEENVS